MTISPKSGLEYQWQRNSKFRGRPPAEYGVPILCTLSPGTSTETFDGLTKLFKTYSKCCPEVANGTNIYVARKECGAHCYTYDYDLRFDECVAATKKELGVNTSEGGYCGLIDYGQLQQGVKSGTTRVAWSIWGGFVALTAAEVLAVPVY